jgi:hypothetical protein
MNTKYFIGCVVYFHFSNLGLQQYNFHFSNLGLQQYNFLRQRFRRT